VVPSLRQQFNVLRNYGYPSRKITVSFASPELLEATFNTDRNDSM
jgi:hypothetical protein